jgi:hypothetical protein
MAQNRPQCTCTQKKFIQHNEEVNMLSDVAKLQHYRALVPDNKGDSIRKQLFRVVREQAV